jgi:hypothetical protein
LGPNYASQQRKSTVLNLSQSARHRKNPRGHARK